MNNDYNKIYEMLEKNSVGEDKRCVLNKKSRIVKLAVPISIIVSTLIVAGFVGVFNNYINDDDTEQQTIYYTYNNYGYNTMDIVLFSEARVYTLLNNNNIIDHTFTEKGKIHYNYSAEDYKKIKELDESYLFTLYEMVDQYTVDEFSKALGYKNLNDYLEKNGYIDKDGEINIKKWSTENLECCAKMMDDMSIKKGKNK